MFVGVGIVMAVAIVITLRGSDTHTIRGTFLFQADASESSISVPDLGNIVPGDECSGLAGYVDIDAGAPVVVNDGSGARIAETTLHPGQVRSASGFVVDCTFPFTLEVPDSATYVIYVADQEYRFSRADVERLDWGLEVSFSA
jgi:hypothetical protein